MQPEVVPGQPQARPAKFAALRNPACRAYLCGGALSMMADSIEHVITYWVMTLVGSPPCQEVTA